ncbi:Uu.00g024340.m01.CDS01 [Anthostomella pinea]|uniref:Uu.00g024340.m01.CDS01 n=1 Tax=Anthostomella pinea TaxID=933095 RepID=A0AAI8YR47_9PEZI|nr:Uu.00g024340.m01.CDS01 [Anthostomella pinea]
MPFVVRDAIAAPWPLKVKYRLVAALIHDIEQALDQGLVATVVTSDVKGAFDAALMGRLVVRMREQGWPDFLIRWVQSFMSERSARVRFEGIEKEVLAAQNGRELGAICSSVPIMMNLCGLNEDGTMLVMWQMIRAWEFRYAELVQEILGKSPSQALETHLKGLESQMAGNEYWSLSTPRYNVIS